MMYDACEHTDAHLSVPADCCGETAVVRRAATAGLTTAQRPDGYRWAELRSFILGRQGDTCAMCDGPATGEDGYWVCDHAWPLSLFGTNDPSNLQVLCIECHRFKSGAEATLRGHARRLGLL